MNVVAIIPARGGSKGVPKKNLQKICGKPLIYWSIMQARASNFVNSVWVSSDDDEILSCAVSFGAKTITRPLNISNDTASSESAWLHSLKHIRSTEKSVDLILGMQATSPIRAKFDIDNAIETFRVNELDSLFTANSIKDFHIWKKNKVSFEADNYNFKNRKPRQKMEEKFLENGSFYLFKPEILEKEHNRLGGKIGCYVMEAYQMPQIDNFEDIKLCETIMLGYGLT